MLLMLYLIAITAEAMTGALSAGRRGMDWFGVVMIACVTALGGGSLRDILLGHLHALHAFYGEPQGVRIARKHLGWYARDRPENAAFRAVVNRAEDPQSQIALTTEYFDRLIAGEPALPSAA